MPVEENILLPLWVNRHLAEAERLALARALAVGTRRRRLDEPFEGVAPTLSKRLAEAIASLKGSELSVLIAQSDLNHSRRLIDAEFVIERRANVQAVAGESPRP